MGETRRRKKKKKKRWGGEDGHPLEGVPEGAEALADLGALGQVVPVEALLRHDRCPAPLTSHAASGHVTAHTWSSGHVTAHTWSRHAPTVVTPKPTGSHVHGTRGHVREVVGSRIRSRTKIRLSRLCSGHVTAETANTAGGTDPQ
eukprot:338517-Rhodomonas_salina.1